MYGLTDFHSHILPGIDDGSASVEESLELLRMEAEQGIRRVVATPHFYARHDAPEQFLERREQAENALRRAMDSHMPQLVIGAEVHYFRGISESDALPQLTIAGTNCLLLELPPAPWRESVYRELEEIWNYRDILPVIAHVDRYISPLRTYHIPRRLAALPVLVQANGSFFLNRSTASMAMRMLGDNQIHLLGSDCHNVSERKPNLAAVQSCIRQKLGTKVLERIQKQEQMLLG